MRQEAQAGQPPDFRVRYRFYSAAEGGRQAGPFQGYRSDWSYAGDDTKVTGIYMIHPEFELPDGSLVPPNVSAPSSGTARMWIVIHEMRETLHRARVRVGVRGFPGREPARR